MLITGRKCGTSRGNCSGKPRNVAPRSAASERLGEETLLLPYGRRRPKRIG